jgi:aspartyl-tRNA(Asn)/glutamyl-tRNA(Gln) amidotransferase subunit A
LFSFTSISLYHTALLNGQTTCVEAVQHYIDKILAKAPLNAWLEVYTDEALERANTLDEARSSASPIGRLHGVVIGLKDVIAYKDHKLSASSKILENFTAVYNATATQRLLDEGAIIIGRNNCDEFAMGSSNENSAFGIVKNALDEQRVPGGSSGGSAVAVQAGMCMVSLGSDTGGSVRQPADFCGIIGFKPSYGTISRYGLIAYASSFDQIGIFAREIEDVRLVLQVIAGADDYDSTVSHKPLSADSKHGPDYKYRVAYFANALDHPSLDPQISSSTKAFIQTLKDEGHAVEPINFGLLDYVVATYYVLTTAEASSNLSRYDGIKYGARSAGSEDITNLYKQTRSEYFGAEVKKRILLGTFVLSAGYFDAYFAKAQKVRRLLTSETRSIFKMFDFLILPTVPTPAFKIGEKSHDPISMFLADIYTVYANLVGVPAISLPLFNTREGLPFGLQVLASQHNELHLLTFSNMLLQLSSGKVAS